MKNYLVLYCIFICLCFGCNNDNTRDEDEVIEFVKAWNDSHSQLESPYLRQNYMDVVNYYGNEFTRYQVQQDKNLLFQRFPNYSQVILNDEIEVAKVGGNFLIKFTKRVKYAKVEADYKSFLTVTSRNGDYKILREGVDNNDKDLDAPIFPTARSRDVFMNNTRQLFGDFDGDGLSDYANVIAPKVIVDPKMDVQNGSPVVCEEECDSLIVFSSEDLEDIIVKNSYQSKLVNLNDLNSDIAQEIGYWDIKPTSKTLYVYDALKGSLLCKPIVINTKVHENLKLIDVFKKTGPNKIKITYSENSDGKWILKSEELTL